MEEYPDMKCKCGNLIPDLHYCEQCNQINFGKRKMSVVGGAILSPK